MEERGGEMFALLPLWILYLYVGEIERYDQVTTDSSADGIRFLEPRGS
jgi:hypothetical protein